MEWGGTKAKHAVERGNVDLVIIAENSPAAAREELEHYAQLSGVPLVEYPGTSWDLGEACGRPHMVNALIIRDAGDSRLTEQLAVGEEEE
jgi:large subunit ribosomal protein L30e